MQLACRSVFLSSGCSMR